MTCDERRARRAAPPAHPVRARARRAAPSGRRQRQAGRRGARARRRHDRGVRRRHVRRVDRAGQALALLDSGEPLLLRICPDRGAATSRASSSCTTRACPAARSRSSSSRSCRRRSSSSSATRRSPARCCGSAARLGLRRRRRATGAVPADVARWSSPRTAATRRRCSRPPCAPDVPYVGLVASRKRGDAVLGCPRRVRPTMSRVHTPAGLDIGARTPGGGGAVDPGRDRRRPAAADGPPGERGRPSRTTVHRASPIDRSAA